MSVQSAAVAREVTFSHATKTTWSAAELLATEFPEPRWAVPGLIAEGVNLLAGAPKLGKSWLALNVAVAVATGGRALGKVEVSEGDVLYLALEDPPRRLKQRLGILLRDEPAPARLTFATACETLTTGGVERIDAWLVEHPDARLVIVDVFARIRGHVSEKADRYQTDYTAMAHLKDLADRYGVAVLVVHHTRKAVADDFLDTISGTQGLAGAADAVLVLSRSRNSADAKLGITGRDVEEHEYALRAAFDVGAWELLDGPASDYELGDTRRAIAQLLRTEEVLTPKQISERLDAKYDTVRQTVRRMVDAGQLDTDGSGRYFTPPSPVTTVTPVTQPDLDSDTSDRSDRERGGAAA